MEEHRYRVLPFPVPNRDAARKSKKKEKIIQLFTVLSCCMKITIKVVTEKLKKKIKTKKSIIFFNPSITSTLR